MENQQNNKIEKKYLSISDRLRMSLFFENN